jgi:hypothetical protein
MGAVMPGRGFTCPKCGRSFANEMDLKYHVCTGKKLSGKDLEPTGIG